MKNKSKCQDSFEYSQATERPMVTSHWVSCVCSYLRIKTWNLALKLSYLECSVKPCAGGML